MSVVVHVVRCPDCHWISTSSTPYTAWDLRGYHRTLSGKECAGVLEPVDLPEFQATYELGGWVAVRYLAAGLWRDPP